MYELVDHTADIGLNVSGADLEEFLSDAALGMFAIICDRPPEGKAVGFEFELEADELEGLLIGWLSELLFLFDTESFVPREFNFIAIEPDRIEVRIEGTEVKSILCAREIKAVTHHLLEVKQDNNGYKARVFFDL